MYLFSQVQFYFFLEKSQPTQPNFTQLNSLSSSKSSLTSGLQDSLKAQREMQARSTPSFACQRKGCVSNFEDKCDECNFAYCFEHIPDHECGCDTAGSSSSTFVRPVPRCSPPFHSSSATSNIMAVAVAVDCRFKRGSGRDDFRRRPTGRNFCEILRVGTWVEP